MGIPSSDCNSFEQSKGLKKTRNGDGALADYNDGSVPWQSEVLGSSINRGLD